MTHLYPNIGQVPNPNPNTNPNPPSPDPQLSVRSLHGKYKLVPRSLFPGFGGGAPTSEPTSKARKKGPGDEVVASSLFQALFQAHIVGSAELRKNMKKKIIIIKTPAPPSFRVSFTFASSPLSDNPEQPDHYMFLPTPPLSQHFVLSEKKELMLAEGRGRWTVSQKRIMVRTGYVASGGCTVQRLARRFRSSYCAKVGERESRKRGMRGRWRGKEEILPRKSHDAMKRATIFLCFLFSFVPLKFHAILVTRSETLVTQATGFHVFPLEISCKDFSLSSPTCFLRLQNSPYFCVFKYARAVKQKVSGSRAATLYRFLY